jgi:hypothetical protein
MTILFRHTLVIVSPQGFEVVSTGQKFSSLESMINHFDKEIGALDI